MAHTEGPFAVNIERSDEHSTYISSNLDPDAPAKNAGHWVARCTGPDHADNGKLFAAAPEAVAELGRVTDLLETWAKDHPQDRTSEIDAAIHCARAVIAKAK